MYFAGQANLCQNNSLHFIGCKWNKDTLLCPAAIKSSMLEKVDEINSHVTCCSKWPTKDTIRESTPVCLSPSYKASFSILKMNDMITSNSHNHAGQRVSSTNKRIILVY